MTPATGDRPLARARPCAAYVAVTSSPIFARSPSCFSSISCSAAVLPSGLALLHAGLFPPDGAAGGGGQSRHRFLPRDD